MSYKRSGLDGEYVLARTGDNTDLSAHVTLGDSTDYPFKHLEDLKDGEIVKLYPEQNVYTNKVHDREVVSESNSSVIEPAEQAQLILEPAPIGASVWEHT